MQRQSAEPHTACTVQRMAAQPVSLCIQDTSSLDFNGQDSDEDGMLEVTCMVAQEIDPPNGEKPVQWRLLTNREVDRLVAASELIDWYRARWESEIAIAAWYQVISNSVWRKKIFRFASANQASAPGVVQGKNGNAFYYDFGKLERGSCDKGS